MHRETQKDIGDFDDADRDRYFSRLSDNVGVNLRVCLADNLTVPEDQDTLDNLSIYGGILDSEDFVEMKNKYQGGTLIKRWLLDLLTAARSSGLSNEQYLKSGHFRTLAVNFLGEKDGGRIADEVTQISKETVVNDAFHMLAHTWLRKALSEDGVELTDKFLFDKLRSD
jgi:hypothetical protein